jgi:hypothetical protein
MACAVFNCTYAHLRALLYAHTARSVLHVSPGPDAAAHGGTSLSGGDAHPSLHGLDSHDGPVVMLTCQGFAGPTPCVRSPVL